MMHLLLNLIACCQPVEYKPEAQASASDPAQRTRLRFGLVYQRPAAPQAEKPARQVSVFDLPRQQQAQAQVASQTIALFQARRYAEAEAMLTAVVQNVDQDVPLHRYNLACAQARVGKLEAALNSLQLAIDRGFHDVNLLRTDEDLKELRDRPEFATLVDAAKKAQENREQLATESSTHAGAVRDGVALVDEKNVAYDVSRGVFVVRHAFEAPAAEKPPCLQMGTAGELVRHWHLEGTAAGLQGVLYDNHDGDHSNLDYGKFPQLTRVEYSEAARQRGLHLGLQQWFLHDAPLLGNASMAATGGPFWGSMPRIALRQPRLSGIQYLHYTSNQLYFYPEHRDHDVDGHGDVYPANTPYVIISQGSSGSDRPFMHAAALTLAALSPATQQAVIKSKLLCPTLQMILRRSLKGLATDEDYLSGRAHPTVFDLAELDVERMVRLAHELPPDDIPPLVMLRVVDEDVTVPGVDYFDAAPAERLLDTPCAIARVARASRNRRRLVVRAVVTPNSQPVTYQWKLLRGDPRRVQLQPSEDGQECEVVVAWHERRAIQNGADLQSCRVDVGVFAKQRERYSAPSFISWLFPANEERTYDEQGRIVSIEQHPNDKPERYVDPVVVTPAVWRDEYRHDQQGRLLGWTRKRDGQTEEFTRDGALVQSKDEHGRAVEARTVRYLRKQASPATGPRLVPELSDEVLTYSYANAEDQIGEIKSRRPVETVSGKGLSNNR